MNKVGRPKKDNLQSEKIVVYCTKKEREVILQKAKLLRIPSSVFLRDLGLKGMNGIKIKPLPKEILVLTAMLNQLAASIRQVARKRDQNEELSEIEREDLTILGAEIKQLALDIKKLLQ